MSFQTTSLHPKWMPLRHSLNLIVVQASSLFRHILAVLVHPHTRSSIIVHDEISYISYIS